MKLELEALALTFLAPLALGLACASEPSGQAEGSETEPGTSTDSSTDTGDHGYVCEDPEVVFQRLSEIDSGFVRCADGLTHRAEVVTCVEPQGSDAELCGTGDFGSCATAADCTDQAYGSCTVVGDVCKCSYGCASDADCDDGFVCACAGVVGDRATCIPATCEADASCGEGLCGLSVYEGCCDAIFALACTDDDAACHSDADCGPDACGDGQCSLGPATSEWGCYPPDWCECACGRPFLVDGVARVAAPLARADWRATTRLPSPVDPSLAPTLAAAWTEIGQFEHASIASFARFAAQLLRLGAPPALVRATQAALADEIEHARLAFALASAYAGAPVGPGPLALGAAASPSDDLEAIVAGLIDEACVGETLAALEAAEAALHARDPAVAAVLERIAADELEHARLGWRSLAWILAVEPSLRRFALPRLDQALAALAEPSRDRVVGDGERPRAAALREHGLLDPALRLEVRRAALAQVLRPCVARLRAGGTNRAAPVARA